ncbi:LuxR family transcriptional regulator [Paenibacillus sp. SSG-1]|uniref:LuxR C-terminal-related transcriptional regulator n=1 Tax=Paenibacillus sp. SSG-1 TaxID=1443669 RepID=UPI000B7E9FBF|nr:LuxR C-terminal-related transcriptional regulator [Paenibacillus sp. SSG-1]OXL86393.1 LuxR family transcriptional regulator [Paenibacillus sp. SSG-1]
MITRTDAIILKTKITLPFPKDGLVERERLLQSLSGGVHGRLTLIYAPAGSGKTTLLTQWAQSEGVNCAWLALDGRDNDPVRFWRYAAFALAEILPAPAALRMLELADALPSLSADAFLDALMNELYGLSEPVKLILDDYHWIEDDRIHNGLSYLIDYMPPTLHVTVASRKEVPFPASKWLSKRECIVVDADRLQFTRDESEQFYHKSGIMRLTPRQIDRIAERTEGWAAGLQLASLSLRAAEDVDRWIEGFYGDHRDVADYLFQEVLAQLPADLRSFVLTTAVLDRMDAGICSLLTGDPASGDKLDAARRFNLFLIPLDLKHKWFRYHHLFAGFVREHLKRHQPDEWLRLNRLASRGFASRGLLDEAVDHAMAAGDYAEAGRLLEQHIPAVLERGEVSVLLRWFEGFPPSYELSMELSLLYAFVLVLTGHFGQAETRLGSLEASTRMLKESERLKQLQSGILFVRSNLMFASGDFTNWFAFIGTMLDDILPADPTYYMFNYNKTEPLVRRTALGLKGVLSADTEKIGTLFMGVLAAHGWQGSLIHLYVKQSLVEGYYEWNRLGECRQMLQEMTALTEKLNVPGLLVPMLLMKARLLIADDRTALAHDVIDEVLDAPLSSSAGWGTPWVHLLTAFKVRMHLADGQMPAARKLMARLGLTAKDKPTFQREYEMMTLVRLLGKQRKENEALRILEHLLPQSEREQLVSGIVENHTLQALLKEQLGQKTAALRHLHTALFLGERSGYIRSFVDEGKPMMSLLGRYEAAVIRGESGGSHEDVGAGLPGEVSGDYVRTLLRLFPVAMQETAAAAAAPAASAEPLSRSESELLRLIGQGASNKEMAAELALSEGTIKVYLSRLYEKLGVSSRTQALVTARQLGLLS